MLLVKRVGPAGAVLQTRLAGSDQDDLIVTFPPSCFQRETEIILSLNAGSLHLRSGTASGVVFRLFAVGVDAFKEAVSLQVRYDAVRWNGYVPIGYAIDPVDGELAAIDFGPLDRTKGQATFYTNVPLLFTWGYAKP